MPPKRRSLPPAAVLLALALAAPAAAVAPPDRPTETAALEVRDPRLLPADHGRRLDELSPAVAAEARRRLARLGVAPDQARIDPGTGRWRTLILARPLVPGSGVGNVLRWGASEPAGPRELGERTREAFAAFMERHRSELGIDPAELAFPGRVTVHGEAAVVQIWAPRHHAGTPVRGSHVTAVVNHGNLVLLGARRWGDLPEAVAAPRLTAAEAEAVVAAHLGPLAGGTAWRRAGVELVPLAADRGGMIYRPAWALHPEVAGDPGRWQALVDATDGTLLLFEDTNRYAAATPRRVLGGVFPVSNDGTPPDGVEQASWPMPFDRVTTPGGTVVTDSGGNLPGPVEGTIGSRLDGTHVRILDTCGAIDLTSEGDLDFGVSPGTDCDTPGFGGPGNTHAARTGFYALNRIAEQARAQLPDNAWLHGQVTAEVNLQISCAAFWNGEVLSFGRSSGACANAGEVAAIYDHEWGHALDDNDSVPQVSNPGEGIADVYSALHLNVSCIARSFLAGNCSGYGDPCVDCTGVRDIDWANRLSGEPHDLEWIDANCSSGPAPCGGIPQCEGAVTAEAVWDLYTRTLRQPPYSFSADTALEAATRLTYVGAGGVGSWYQCTPPFGGCNADGGYLNYLAADDDNGDLADGTPHMTAIFRAFDLHQIACDAPAPGEGGTEDRVVAPGGRLRADLHAGGSARAGARGSAGGSTGTGTGGR